MKQNFVCGVAEDISAETITKVVVGAQLPDLFYGKKAFASMRYSSKIW
jgi:hypothetical protein